MAAFYPFMKQLVTSGSYDITNTDGNKKLHKVNLLNSVERYYVENEVVTRLENINTDIFILTWQVRTYLGATCGSPLTQRVGFL